MVLVFISVPLPCRTFEVLLVSARLESLTFMSPCLRTGVVIRLGVSGLSETKTFLLCRVPIGSDVLRPVLGLYPRQVYVLRPVQD